MNNETFYIIIAGTRTYEDYAEFSSVMDKVLPPAERYKKIVIICGDARGADALARQYAEEKGYENRVFYADWDRFGKRAGHIRNAEMHKSIENEENKACILFWDMKSPGTKSNINIARFQGTQLKIFNIAAHKFDRTINTKLY